MSRTIGGFFVVTTSNNPADLSAQAELYNSPEAFETVRRAKSERWHGRDDWVAVPLAEAIEASQEDAINNALDEG